MNALSRAEQRALRLYPGSKGFRRAYLNGWLAASAGRSTAACPYRDRVGWGSPWRIAWMRGHLSGATPADEQEE